MAIGIQRKENSLLLNGIDSSLEIIFAECFVPVAEINFLCFLWLVLLHCFWAKKWKRWKLVGWNNSKFLIQIKIRQAGFGYSLQLVSVLFLIFFNYYDLILYFSSDILCKFWKLFFIWAFFMMKYEKCPNTSMLKLVVSVIYFWSKYFFFNTARECLVYLQWELKDFGSGCQVTSMYAAAVLMETWLALSTAMQRWNNWKSRCQI